MRDRAVGIENEYGISVIDRNGEASSLTNYNDSSVHVRLKEYKGYLDALCAASSGSGIWLSNGSRFYIDINAHPEYASCETRRAIDAVAYNKAGEIHAREIFKLKRNKEFGYNLFKNNVSRDSQGTLDTATSFGCHENYTLYGFKPPGRPESFAARHLIPFLLTRQIFDGSGTWGLNGQFYLSQRALFVEEEIGGSTTNRRPIIHTRDEPHMAVGDTSVRSRLHLIIGDANMLEFPIFLKVGTTSLMLAMLEDGITMDWHCNNAVNAMGDISRNGLAGISKKLVSFEGYKKLSALEVQKEYLQLAKRYVAQTSFESAESKEEAELVVKYWQKTLDALENGDNKWLLGRLDYLTKKNVVDRQIKRKNITSFQEKKELRSVVDTMYHCVTDTEFSGGIQATYKKKRLLTDEQIKHAVAHPPKDTRANIRGKFTRLVVEKNNMDALIGWTSLKFSSNMDDIKIEEPLESTNEYFEQLCRQQRRE